MCVVSCRCGGIGVLKVMTRRLTSSTDKVDFNASVKGRIETLWAEMFWSPFWGRLQPPL